ncbi:MAG: segregation/condensation protein A [Candidatus Aenigmarchaeota archaeon]|nr:segregation/condensation protein A [Candidatus Aenigmarchaeota archaeon]
MLDDQQLINLMVNEPSWEDVIVKIIAEEQMDPWNIDIVQLSDAFSNHLTTLEHSDLRMPARFILIAAILLRMKSDILAAKKQKSILAEGAIDKKRESELIEMLSKIPPLQAPIKRIPMKSVALDELVGALKKAFAVEERRKERKWRVRKAVNRILPDAEVDDITKRIDGLMEQIQGAMVDIESDIEFSRLVNKWERKTIVKTLMPLLHLSQEGKIKINQKELFKEIYVELSKNGHTN